MTVFAIKIIASVCMLIDHIGAVIPDTPDFFRWIGRIVFPLYAYLIAEGGTYTKNIGKYMLRLGVFALISQIPFCLAFGQGNYIYRDLPLKISFSEFTNVFYTLFFGAACIGIYRKLNSVLVTKRLPAPVTVFIPVAAALPLTITGTLLDTDYGSFGIILIFSLYLAKGKPLKLAVIFAAMTFKYGYQMIERASGFTFSNIMLLFFALLSIPLLAFYNGRTGLKLKWIFYWFYPLHLSALAFLWLLFLRPSFNGF